MNHTIELYRIDVASESFELIDVIDGYRGLYFSNKLNRVGSGTFTLDIQNPKATEENLRRWATQVVIKRDGTAIWLGTIINVNGRYGGVGGTVQVNMGSYMAHLLHRFTDKPEFFVQTEQSEIAWGMIENTQNETNGWLGIEQGANPTGQLRDRTYENAEIAYALENLSEVQNGIDFEFRPNMANDRLDSVIFDVYSPQKGEDKSDLPPLKIGVNVQSVDFDTDSTLTNSVRAYGNGTGDDIITYSTSNTGMMTAYTRIEKILNRSDISVPQTLQDTADNYLLQNQTEKYKISIATIPNTTPYLGQVALGDYLKLEINKGYAQFNGKYRVEEIRTSVDDNGVGFDTFIFSTY